MEKSTCAISHCWTPMSIYIRQSRINPPTFNLLLTPSAVKTTPALKIPISASMHSSCDAENSPMTSGTIPAHSPVVSHRTIFGCPILTPTSHSSISLATVSTFVFGSWLHAKPAAGIFVTSVCDLKATAGTAPYVISNLPPRILRSIKKNCKPTTI